MAYNFSALLAKLTPIVKGQPLADQFTVERFNSLFEIVRGLVSGENIFKGQGILRRSGPGGVTLSAIGGNSETSTSSTPTFCPLRLFDASNENEAMIGIEYGSIAGRHPAGFKAGGVPPYKAAISGDVFIFAYGTINLNTRLFISAGIKITSEFGLMNTTDTVYKLIGSAKAEAGNGGSVSVTVAQARCGPISMDSCETL